MPLPCYQTRKKIIDHELQKRNLYDQKYIRWDFLGDFTTATEEFSGRDIISVINQAELLILLNISTESLQWYTFTFNTTYPFSWWKDRIGLKDKMKKAGRVLVSPLEVLARCPIYGLGSTKNEAYLYWAYTEKFKQKGLKID